MIGDILQFAREKTDEGNRVALVTVTETNGSSPASPGQMIAVSADGTTKGTVGGGATEHKVILEAQAAMEQGRTVFSFDYNHAESGMVCGGGMRGFGNVLGNENHLVLFGGGHVAQSLAPLAHTTGFAVTVVEDRPEFADAFPSARYITCQPEEYQQMVPFTGSVFAVICTRGHRTDDQALRFCLQHSPKYIGMIGSRTKVAAAFGQLQAEGYSQQTLEQVYTPIGLDIASGIPAEIAVSILAEILLVKNGGSPNHKKSHPVQSTLGTAPVKK